MMKGRYNIHRQAATQSRATHAKYKGQVDFKGGAYGILKGAMERDLEVEGGGTESDESRELQQMRLRIELLERENRAKERALDLVKREQEMRAKTGGAPQSQVINCRNLLLQLKHKISSTGGGYCDACVVTLSCLILSVTPS